MKILNRSFIDKVCSDVFCENIDKNVKYILIIVLGIVFYIILAGKQWVAIEDDSAFYMNSTGNEGVMPGYPFWGDTQMDVWNSES